MILSTKLLTGLLAIALCAATFWQSAFAMGPTFIFTKEVFEKRLKELAQQHHVDYQVAQTEMPSYIPAGANAPDYELKKGLSVSIRIDRSNSCVSEIRLKLSKGPDSVAKESDFFTAAECMVSIADPRLTAAQQADLLSKMGFKAGSEQPATGSRPGIDLNDTTYEARNTDTSMSLVIKPTLKFPGR